MLDPKRTDCHYPYKELSGCGIGFKLISAVARKKHLGYDSVNKYLDFVVVSIAADIVPITGENRVLAYYGLQRLNKEPSEGLRALIELNQLKKPLTVSDLVFIVGPASMRQEEWMMRGMPYDFSFQASNRLIPRTGAQQT